MRFELYQDRNDHWRWRLKAGNGRIVADSGEGYVHRQHCIEAVTMVMDTSRRTEFVEI